jgi:hypothetical protein
MRSVQPFSHQTHMLFNALQCLRHTLAMVRNDNATQQSAHLQDALCAALLPNNQRMLFMLCDTLQ